MGLAAPLLAIILAGAQPPPVSAQAAPPPSAPGGSDAGEHGPARLAAVTFAFACLQRVDDAPAEFAKRSEGLGAEFAKDHPAEAAFVTLDGDGGQGCRVRLRGPDAQTMWNAWRSVPSIFGPGAGTGCAPLETADLRVRALCDAAGSPPRRYEVVVERTSTGADATVSAVVRHVPQ